MSKSAHRFCNQVYVDRAEPHHGYRANQIGSLAVIDGLAETPDTPSGSKFKHDDSAPRLSRKNETGRDVFVFGN